MIDRETKRKSGRPWSGSRRVVLASVVLLGGLALGQMVMTDSLSAANASGDTEAQMGEALMEMASRLQSGGGPSPATGPGWYTCEVHRAGPGWGNVYLSLSSTGNFSARWFKAAETQEKEMLAAGLAALSANKKVYVRVTGTGPTPYGEIQACYVTK